MKNRDMGAKKMIGIYGGLNLKKFTGNILTYDVLLAKCTIFNITQHEIMKSNTPFSCLNNHSKVITILG